jgi:hypothetical protein
MDPVVPLSPYSPECVEVEFSEVHKEYARRWRRVRKDAIVPNNMR